MHKHMYVCMHTVSVPIGRVHDEDAPVTAARRSPGPLDVRDEERQVLLGQLGVQLALERHRVEARVAVVAGRLVLNGGDVRTL